MYDFAEGEVLLVDKPYHWTSFDVVKKIKIAGKIKKVGHAGTLDPLATGLLILCTGKKTKQIDLYQAAEKEYTGTMLLGKTTPSIDLETSFNNTYSLDGITIPKIQQAIIQFLGTIQQAPPIFSALKVDGVRAYKKARKGDTTTELAKRTLFIQEFELTSINLPTIEFRLICSKGTYVRSLVRDFGVALGIGACLIELRRTRIGRFHINNAISPAEFVQSLNQPS